MPVETYLLEDVSKKLPKWKRTYHVGADRAIFVSPCICGMNDKAAFWAITWDGGHECVQDHGHVYVALEWLIEEFPDKTEFLTTIRGIVRSKHGLSQ